MIEIIQKYRNTIYAIIGGVFLFSVGLIVSIILLGSDNKQSEYTNSAINKPTKNVKEDNKNNITRTKDDPKLEALIEKANTLYQNGEKLEALNIFERIAIFSQSVASYNLGVIKINENKYRDAISSFENAILSGEDVSISAINAAYSANKIQQKGLFDYYLSIANAYLNKASEDSFYSYLYGAIKYYNGNYFEALSPLLHPNSTEYKTQSDILASKIFLMFNDDKNALLRIKSSRNPQDDLVKGLLYARVGEYRESKKAIYDFLANNPNDKKALAALELVELQLGNFGEASSILDKFYKDEKTFMSFYPIKTKLKDSFFDMNLAQKQFWAREFEHKKSLQYKILFYFAPYKVFNAKEALDIIEKGGIDYNLQRIDESTSDYSMGKTISMVNKNISIGLKKILNGNLRNGMEYFKKSVRDYPQHSILHYDMGLSYAQMGDFEKAYKHFLHAYYLNHRDILAGIFALMAGELSYQNTERLYQSIRTDIQDIDSNENNIRDFFISMLDYVMRDEIFNTQWLNEVKNEKPLYYALDIVYAMSTSNKERMTASFLELKKIYKDDVTTNIMYEMARNYGSDIKAVSLEANKFFKDDKLDKSSLYYGPSLSREIYTYLAFITGNLTSVISQAENRLIGEIDSPQGLLQVLGLAYIYSGDFEKAFVTYNTLIDDLKEDDAKTILLGAVGAIGAGHYNNTIALLQLSKINSKSSFESRYALALLYQQMGDIKSASKLLSGISNAGFMSEFFDFEINTKSLVQNQEE